VAEAVAFGDFLRRNPLVQAADVGIRLVPRNTTSGQNSVNQEKEFLKKLRARNPAIQLRPYEPWMKKRSYRRLA
jgi:hypothetical protein